MFLAAYHVEAGLILNICLCVDLILMVRYPFESKDGRVNKYLIVSFILALIPGYFMSSGDTFVGVRIGFGISFALRIIFALTFILSIVYTCKKLSGNGFSKEVRKLVLQRHIITVLLYIITNLYLSINDLVYLKTSNDDLINVFGSNCTWWAKTFKILFAA